VQQPLAAIVDQDLDLFLTINHIGANVPSVYSDNLAVGDILAGSITALNVDDTLDGFQNSTLVDFQLTVAGESFDSAINVVINQVNVRDGVVVGINYFNSKTRPNIMFQTDDFWRITFPEWSQSSPTSLFYEITGGYSTELAPVPLPAAVWLFGSGLLGLIGIARRKTTVSE
jgi:hypothetical protein